MKTLMNTILRKLACVVVMGVSTITTIKAQVYTPGGAKLTATINDLGANSSAKHYALVWLTKADGTFVTTLWKQGPTSFTSSGWSQHCPAWNTARNASTALPLAPDGYTSGTATSYAATNPSPPASGTASNAITITWNGKDANGNVMPDGNYKFFVEYAEEAGTHNTDTGGLTTAGLLWTKGGASFTVNPANQGTVGTPSGGSNFTNMSIVWTPSAPEIAVEYPSGTNLVDGTASIPFGSVNVGQSSAAFTFTVRNSGTAALTLTNPVTKDGTNSSDFTVSSVATSVAAAGNTTFTVTFNPSAAGSRTAAIHIASNDSNENPFDITLTGTGVAAPEIAVEQPAGTNLVDGTATVDYGSVNLGSKSVKTFTVKNTGTAAMTITNPVTKNGTNSADFTVSAIATSLAAGGSTTFTVTFAPSAAGARTAAIHVASNDTDENPFDINLTGAGGAVPEIAVEQPVGTNLSDGTASVSCGGVNVGSSSSALTFTVKNLGTANLTGLAVTKDGANPTDFTVSALGATTLGAGSSTTFTVTFAPGAAGARSAAIHIASNDSDENPFDITLSGSGLVPEIAVEQPAGSNLTGRATFNL